MSLQELNLEPGVLIADRFEVVDYIGAGTVSVVIRAIDHQSKVGDHPSRPGDPQSSEQGGQAEIALKIVRPELAGQRKVLSRMKNEEFLTREFNHRNLVKIHDFYEVGHELYFLVMEYVEGRELYDVMYESERALSVPASLGIIGQVAEGLGYAHSQGVFHRDLKPENIIIALDGTVKITDFGFAKAPALRQQLTVAGERMGTPLYMAPEQFEDGDVDARVDVYSFGLLSFELITGGHPFSDVSGLALMRKHFVERIPVEVVEEYGVPPWFSAMLGKSVEKVRDDRFFSVTEIAELMRQHSMPPPEIVAQGVPPKAAPQARKKRKSVVRQSLFRGIMNALKRQITRK